MFPKNDLLNRIASFKYLANNESTVFSGILQEEEGNIILNAQITLEQNELLSNNTNIILGKIGQEKITLVGCCITSRSHISSDKYFFIHIIPSEIISGGYFFSIPLLKRINITTSDLNYMFSGGSPLQPVTERTADGLYLLKYTSQAPLVAHDEYGEISVSQSFIEQSNNYSHMFNSISTIEYSFTNSLPLTDAIEKISVVRSLFSFFKNGYISYGEITFNSDNDTNIYGLWLNFIENLPIVNEPFLITTCAFETKFQKLWDTWLTLYESAGPIPELFYEIICNRSTGVNGFLNLSQAIEVYSNIFRNDKTRELTKSENINIRQFVPLKVIYEDILSYCKNTLGINESVVSDLSKGFSNMRNYYTHYNSKKYIKPSNDELSAASQILRFVLLTIIYKSVGISVDDICKCKNRKIFSTFDANIIIVKNYSNKENLK